MKPIGLAVAAIALLLSACDAIDLPVRDPPINEPTPGCPADLRPVITPNSGEQTTIQLGDTLQVTYKLFTCAGTREVDITPVWESSDTKVATVDATGLVTAQEVGTTDISVSEAEYGTGAVIEVIVSDPIP